MTLMFTDEECETAMVLWEGLIDLRSALPAIDDWMNRIGPYGARQWCRDHAIKVAALWESIHQDRFEWDRQFIPMVLTLCNWSDATMPTNSKLKEMILNVPHPSP